MTWFKFWKKKQATTWNYNPSASISASTTASNTMSNQSIPSIHFKLTPRGKCELCGIELYGQVYTCELCGKKVCLDDVFLLARPYAPAIAVGTIPFSVGRGTFSLGQTQRTPSQDESMYICVSCADLLKLSLRISAAQGLVEEDENKET